MKKLFAILLSMTMVLSLAACGGEKDAAKDEAVDLKAFYAELADTYNWIEAEGEEEGDEESCVMMDLTSDPEFLESYFPGLSAISTKQLVAETSMISAVVNEYVFVEAESEEDAALVAEILESRVTMQAEGGAWYPESVEAWSNAQVVTSGTFVAMIASQGSQTEIVEAFNALFA